MFTAALAFVLVLPLPALAQETDNASQATTADNATGRNATDPVAKETARLPAVAPDAEPDSAMDPLSSDPEAPQRTPDRSEARGTMPEREPAPRNAGKPAPGTQPESEPIPGGNVGWTAYFQALGAIFLILAVLAGGFYLLKRFGPRAMGGGVFGRGTLQLEAQLPLGPRRSVVVVRFLNKRLVLGVTDSNINLLTETETGHDDEVPEYTSTPQSGSSAFSRMLAKARNSRS